MEEREKKKNAVEYSTVQYSTVQYSTVQHSTAQYSTAQHSTTQHSTAQHSTAQHSTAQNLTLTWKLSSKSKLADFKSEVAAIKVKHKINEFMNNRNWKILVSR